MLPLSAQAPRLVCWRCFATLSLSYQASSTRSHAQVRAKLIYDHGFTIANLSSRLSESGPPVRVPHDDQKQRPQKCRGPVNWTHESSAPRRAAHSGWSSDEQRKQHYVSRRHRQLDCLRPKNAQQRTSANVVSITTAPTLFSLVNHRWGRSAWSSDQLRLESHSALEHLGFEISGVHLPLGSLRTQICISRRYD